MRADSFMLPVALRSGLPCNLSAYELLLAEYGLFWQLNLIADWRSRMMYENAAAECADKALRESGHPDVVQCCGTNKVGTTALPIAYAARQLVLPNNFPKQPVWGVPTRGCWVYLPAQLVLEETVCVLFGFLCGGSKQLSLDAASKLLSRQVASFAARALAEEAQAEQPILQPKVKLAGLQ